MVNSADKNPMPLTGKQMMNEGERPRSVKVLATCAVAASLIVLVPVGHAALPAVFGFLRFLNPQYNAEAADWLIVAVLGISVASVVAVWVGRSTYPLVAIPASCSTMLLLIFKEWADPADYSLLVVMGIPFVVCATAAIVLDVRSKTMERQNCGSRRGP
jgi:hypothetical protein